MERRRKSGVSHSQITVENAQKKRDEKREATREAGCKTHSVQLQPSPAAIGRNQKRPQRAQRPRFLENCPIRRACHKRVKKRAAQAKEEKKKTKKEKQVNKTDELPPAGRTTFFSSRILSISSLSGRFRQIVSNSQKRTK